MIWNAEGIGKLIKHVVQNFRERAERGKLPGWLYIALGFIAMMYYIPSWLLKEARDIRKARSE